MRKRIPKTVKALERAYSFCEKKKAFRVADKNTFSDYVLRGQKDIASAQNDFQHEDFHWVRVKAYQALFHILNALLVKHCGYFSKDHSCILSALLKNNIITEEIAEKLHLVVGNIEKCAKTVENAVQDIDDLRIQRNFALYKPKAWEEVTKHDIKDELEKIKKNIEILVDLL
jgi:uncharacterized protein (UPF0332 family)